MTKQKHTYSNIMLLIVPATAFLVRTWDLGNNPPGLFADEASVGYNAYSLLKTGKDEYGKFLPIFFRSFGDYRPPIAVYTAIPFVEIFGLSEFSVRLQSVFFGLVTIVSLYFLSKGMKYEKSLNFPLIVTLVASFLPWLIHYNRTGFEFSSYAALFTLTMLFTFRSIKEKTYILPSFILASLTFYTYQPARLLVVLLVVGSFLILRNNYLKHKKHLLYGLCSFLVIGMPLFLSFVTGEAIARYKMVTIFTENTSVPDLILKLFQNYLIQLSPSYFITGENTFISRHFVGGLRPLLIITIPFFYMGLIHLFLNIKNNLQNQLIILWLVLYPIGGAVTSSPPFTSRSIIGAPLVALIIAIGIVIASDKLKNLVNKKITTVTVMLLILLNFFYFTRFYFGVYPHYSADYWGWQYGPKPIIEHFVKVSDKYDRLCLESKFNAPHIFIRFYDPDNKCQGKCQICNLDQYQKDQDQLFALSKDTYDTSINKIDTNFITIKEINYPNGQPAFYIGHYE